MPFWSGETLKQRMANLVSNYDPKNVDCSAYTLHVGPEVYITPNHRVPDPERHKANFLAAGEDIPIPSGQFGFVLTEEVIEVPDDAMAFISMKTRAKFRGLLNASGFHVDPGFKGRLIFAVFNAGPNSISIKRGDALFLIWYASLDQKTNEKKNRNGYTEIPSELINGISGEIHSVRSISDQIKSIKTELDERSARENEKIHKVEKQLTRHNVILASALALLMMVAGYILRDSILESVNKISAQQQAPFGQNNLTLGTTTQDITSSASDAPRAGDLNESK